MHTSHLTLTCDKYYYYPHFTHDKTENWSDLPKVTQLESGKIGTPTQVYLALESKLFIIKLFITLQDQNRKSVCGCSEYCKGPRFYLKTLIIGWTISLDEIVFF